MRMSYETSVCYWVVIFHFSTSIDNHVLVIVPESQPVLKKNKFTTTIYLSFFIKTPCNEASKSICSGSI